MAPTIHAGVSRWVDEITALCAPSRVHWCDGSEGEYRSLCDRLVAAGTFTPLAARPRSYVCRTHPSDTARVEDRTFICSLKKEDAGPTNHWAEPLAMKQTLLAKFRGSMAGRTMYVIPFCMGPLGSPLSRIGVEITDSAYVAVSMRAMTRMGAGVLRQLEKQGKPGAESAFVPCLHSLGAPLAPGQLDVPWPCAPDPADKYIVHFPDDPSIWSFGSGYGGNALLGKKCLALRIASTLARREGWMAEHMLILSLTSPAGATRYITAAFPSACGKTNLAMLTPSLPGWTVRCVGDDIAWMHVGPDGMLRAVNPEAGFFGVAPGTSEHSNPNAMASIRSDTIFTNVATTPDGDVWWEGMTEAPPAGLVDWHGKPWDPGSGEPAAQPNARFTVPIAHCPVLDPHWDDPEGVPISAIVFGGRRPGTIPLVNEALSWEHGVFLGSTIASETTAASTQQTGVLRRDPFAMFPFCGYHMGDYFAHWLAMGRALGANAPRVFCVNWFRKDAAGHYLWPGYGENIRVLKWMCERMDGEDVAERTDIGWLPKAGSLDLSGLELSETTKNDLRAVDKDGWRREVHAVSDHYAKFEPRLPAALAGELRALKQRLGILSHRIGVQP